MQDHIVNLPTDDSMISPKEAQLIKQYFPEVPSSLIPILTNKTYLSVFKEAFIGSIIFAILSQPFVKEYVGRFLPSTTSSPAFMMIVLMILFISLFFLVNNFYLSKVNTK